MKFNPGNIFLWDKLQAPQYNWAKCNEEKQ